MIAAIIILVLIVSCCFAEQMLYKIKTDDFEINIDKIEENINNKDYAKAYLYFNDFTKDWDNVKGLFDLTLLKEQSEQIDLEILRVKRYFDLRQYDKIYLGILEISEKIKGISRKETPKFNNIF